MSILEMLRPPSGLRVLVTAGAGGTGAAVARAFVQAGARVHVCDIDRSALDRLARDTPGIAGSMADVSDRADVERVFDDLQRTLGGLDVLVSSAAIAGPAAPIEEIDVHGWERTFAVNVHGAFHVARRAVPLLKASSLAPCLIAIGPASHAQAPGGTPQAASASALSGMMSTLADELGPHGIRVHTILPGVGPAVAEHVAAFALLLCAPAAHRLTGQSYALGGAAPAVTRGSRAPPPAAA